MKERRDLTEEDEAMIVLMISALPFSAVAQSIGCSVEAVKAVVSTGSAESTNRKPTNTKRGETNA